MSKTIFITGVSSGIGFDAAVTLVRQGYKVIGTVRKTGDADRIKSLLGDNFVPLVFDVTDREACQRQISSVFHLLEADGLFALINNAGMTIAGPLEILPDDEFESVMDVNVFAVRRITNLLLPYLGTNSRYQPGKLINISSVSGLFNSPFNGSYCISKHALESMTDIYRRELSMFGISVTAIEPGPVKSEIWAKNKGTLARFADSAYGQILSKADKMIENAEKSAFATRVISDLIINILQNPNPDTRYLVHRKKWMFRLLSHWLPDRMADRLVQKAMSQGDNYRPV